MTIRAENPQILESVVTRIAVDVIELERNAAVVRSLRPTAFFTGRPFDSCFEKTLLELVALERTAAHKDLIESFSRPSGSSKTFVPSLAAQMVGKDAVLLDVLLDLGVIASGFNQPEMSQHLPDTRRAPDGVPQILLSPPSTPHFCRVTSRQTLIYS